MTYKSRLVNHIKNYRSPAHGLILVALMGLLAAPSFAEQADAAAATGSEIAVVNLNTADAETLARVLTGIGEDKAEAIVAWREANGEFKSVDELTQIKGIGQATLNKNRDRLSL